jgi:uroporphyrinogen decarboxylase-like protein
MDRPNPGEYSARERLLRMFRREKTDRLPISPTALTPFTWHTGFPVYHPVIELAKKHCEFMPGFGLPGSPSYLDPAVIKTTVKKEEHGTRKTRTTTLQTPKGPLTQIQIHDEEVGSWGRQRFFVEDADDLAKWESLPADPYHPAIGGMAEFDAKVGDAGLPYLNGVQDALNTAVGMIGDNYRPLFCFTETERLRKMVDAAQERVYTYVKDLLEQDAGPVFRWYAIEPFVEPVMPPSFVKEFIVPYDREIVKLIHDHGKYVVMHCHGRLRAQIEHMCEIGIDGVDCVECPPQNDIALAEMMEIADGRLFLWGYIQFEDLARFSGDEIEAKVKEAVEMGGTDGRYMLGQAASPWSADISQKTVDNWILMIEAGVKYGGH